MAGKLRNAVTFPQTIDFIYALDGAQFNHNLVRTNDLRLRKCIFDSLHDHNGRIQITSNTDAQLLSGYANRLEDIVVRIRFQFRIRRVCAFAIFLEHKDLIDM
ncbi:hypothetical protein SDC9_114608 [bioreactor metagenome]|uniref:Uncharacterized protein n=1 Tax=bioreactor metagenome TaxID=1076179 RepID=A0A645C144_9ZZZZ